MPRVLQSPSSSTSQAKFQAPKIVIPKGVNPQVNIANGTNGFPGPKAVPLPAAILLPVSGPAGIAGIEKGIRIKQFTILVSAIRIGTKS